MLLKNSADRKSQCRELVSALLQEKSQKSGELTRQIAELLGRARGSWTQCELESFCREEQISILAPETPDGPLTIGLGKASDEDDVLRRLHEYWTDSRVLVRNFGESFMGFHQLLPEILARVRAIIPDEDGYVKFCNSVGVYRRIDEEGDECFGIIPKVFQGLLRDPPTRTIREIYESLRGNDDPTQEGT